MISNVTSDVIDFVRSALVEHGGAESPAAVHAAVLDTEVFLATRPEFTKDDEETVFNAANWCVQQVLAAI